jgi:hypothetical protein
LPLDYPGRQQEPTLTRDYALSATTPEGFMQYDEHRLAELAATVAAGFARDSQLLARIADKEKTRLEARNLARVSLMVARHIMVAAHSAAQKVDELELLYDDADFL